MTIHRIRLLGDPFARALRTDHQTQVHRRARHPGRHARDAPRLAVPLRQRPGNRRPADRRAGPDDLRGDGQALAADQSRNRGHRHRGLRRCGTTASRFPTCWSRYPGPTGSASATRMCKGEWHEDDLEGDRAELLQHEIDHLDGVLAVDRPHGLDPSVSARSGTGCTTPVTATASPRRSSANYATPLSGLL